MHKIFIYKVLLLSLPFILIIIFINVYIDSALVVRNLSSEIAEIIVSGKNAGIKYIPSQWGNLQTAIVAEQLRQKKTSPKDILVFGTSRSSEINSAIFKKHTFFNCAVPGGNILDYIALYGLYKRHNLLPKYLIISIDPWTFHARKSITVNNEIHYIADTSLPLNVNNELLDEYKNAATVLGLKTGVISDKENNRVSFNYLLELFSLDYFQLNIRSFKNKPVIETTKDQFKPYFILRSDGGYTMALQSEIDSNVVIKKSMQFIDIHKSNFFISADTSSIYFNYFKNFLIRIKEDNITPIIYISPLNPVVFDNLKDSDIVSIENEINIFCKANNITRVGSFNPHQYGYHKVGNLFMDAYHPIRALIEDIFYQHREDLKKLGINI